MSRLVSNFINPDPASQEHHAIEKALRERPRVVPLGESDGRRYFEVTSTARLGAHYVVRLWEDRDGEPWIECFCKAAYPETDHDTGLIAWLPKACYHQGSVLLFESERASQEEENAQPANHTDS